jgi:hypothetical protein
MQRAFKLGRDLSAEEFGAVRRAASMAFLIAVTVVLSVLE